MIVLNKTINIPYRHNPEGVVAWIQQTEQAYTELEDHTKILLSHDIQITQVMTVLERHAKDYWYGET